MCERELVNNRLFNDTSLESLLKYLLYRFKKLFLVR